MNIKINSEIGKLKSILLHRPGKEVERVYPEIFERILFDDIMYVEQAQKDHDYFVEQLIKNGVEVFYIENLVADIFNSQPKLRNDFLNQFIKEGGIKNKSLHIAIFDFFNKEKDNLEFVRLILTGVKKNEIQPKWDNSIKSHIAKENSYPFYLDPIPNILFQRDAIASIFNSMSIHNMTKATRKREGIFYTYLFKYHPEWKHIIKNVDVDHCGHIEGGDVLVMNEKTIFIGISERTNAVGVEELAKSLFQKYNKLKNIIGIKIPESHGTMHLDTIFTQLDVDKFSVDLDMVNKKYLLFNLTWENANIKIQNFKDNIINILKKYVHPNAKLIIVAGGDIVSGKAEQWNDGANCLALEPGVVFVYDRNVYTNKELEKNGIKLIKIPSGELSRGRGGPRCMVMPLEREDV